MEAEKIPTETDYLIPPLPCLVCLLGTYHIFAKPFHTH
jgi:hypothetical protein